MRYLVFFTFLFCSILTFADEKSETCENIAKLANSGQLWAHKILPRKIEPSEVEQFNSFVQTYYQVPNQIVEIQKGKNSLKFAYLISQNPSSCWGMEVGNFDMAIVTKGEDFGKAYETFLNDDTVDLSVNGADDEVVRIKDGYFVISTNYSYGRKSLKTASVIKKDGHIHEMCEFTTNENPKLVIKKAIDQNLCQKVVDGQIEKLPWAQIDDGRVTMSGEPVYSPHSMTVDINMDGKPDIVAWIDESSGGGCGSASYSLGRLSEDQSEILNDDLTKVLQSASESQGHALGHDDNEIQIIRYKSKPYIIGNSKLYSVWGNSLKTWCEFDYLPHHQVSKF